MHFIVKKRNFYILVISFCLVSCSAFFYKLKKFNNSFEKYKFEEANEILSGKKGIKSKGKDRLLFFLNKGVVLHMMGEYKESNKFLESAYSIIRNTRASVAKNILGYFLNPSVSDYMGEDHEILMINYYKALNSIHLNDMDGALRECRRMDLALRMLRQKCKSKEGYKRDAMLYTLMGIIFQANGEYNQAYVSYKNAIDIYENDYKKLFNISVPKQLILDFIHVAHVMGFTSEVQQYENRFNVRYDHLSYIKGNNLICIWNNGMGPFKDSLDINFVVNPSVGGIVHFKNEEMGLNFAFAIPPTSKKDFDVTKTSIFRIAFPKYVERKPLYTKGEIIFDNQIYPFELLDDINKISFKVLKQRMFWEFSETLLRLFLKKIGENRVSKLNKTAGFLYGVFNAVIENADTRNWQTIPHSISYARLKIPEGKQKIDIKVYNATRGKEMTEEVNINMLKGKTKFYIFHTLESIK